MAEAGQKGDLSRVIAGLQVILGMVVFTGAWWIDGNENALYIFGFLIVLLGIGTSLLLTSKRQQRKKRTPDSR